MESGLDGPHRRWCNGEASISVDFDAEICNISPLTVGHTSGITNPTAKPCGVIRDQVL